MKKLFIALTLFLLAAAAHAAQQKTLPVTILPAGVAAGILETEQDYYQAVNLLASAIDTEAVFAAGAALANNPPPNSYEANLLNIAISSNNDLKKLFAAVALASMGENTEVVPLLESGLESNDDVIKGYASAALALQGKSDAQTTANIFTLYPYDYAYAQRALEKVFPTVKKLESAVKKSASSAIAAQRRAAAQMLGKQGTQRGAQTLLTMLKKEKDIAVLSDIALSLAAYPKTALPEMQKCLAQNPETTYTLGCALTLGFMPDHALDVIKKGLSSYDENTRINALRAVQASANVLNGPQAVYYSNDPAFAKQELKTLIPLVAAQSKSGARTEPYANLAIAELKKLL